MGPEGRGLTFAARFLQRAHAVGRVRAVFLGMLATIGSLVIPDVKAASTDAPPPARQQALIHLVRQDCGSCHGLTLQGGLGPALTAERLQGWSPADLSTTILLGRPGTPMPPFKGLLSDADAQWIARQLITGFPKEP